MFILSFSKLLLRIIFVNIVTANALNMRMSIECDRFFNNARKFVYDVTRLNYNINQYLGFVVDFPAYWNQRAAKFKNIRRHAAEIPSQDGTDWSYRDYVKHDEVDSVIDHAHYGRMVLLAYDLLQSDPRSGRYGCSYLSDKDTQKFIAKVVNGYKVMNILKTNLDTPNQKNAKTGEALTQQINLRQFLFYDEDKDNFMGYIAYNEEKKDLAIIFRGTILFREWFQNLYGVGSKWNSTDIDGKNISNTKLNSTKKEYNPTQLSLALFEVEDKNPLVPLTLSAILGISAFLYVFISSTDLNEWFHNIYMDAGNIINTLLPDEIASMLINFDILRSKLLAQSIVDFAINTPGDLAYLAATNRENLVVKVLSPFFLNLGTFPEVCRIFSAFVISLVFAIICNCGTFFLHVKGVKLFLENIQRQRKDKTFQTGFSELYTTACRIETDQEGCFNYVNPKEVIYNAIEKVLQDNKNDIKTITVSGHSLGGSLAVIAALHAAEVVKHVTGSNKIPVNCVTFACPRVGSPEVFKSFKDLNIHHYHYLNRGDIVPIVMPGIFTNGLGYPNNHVLRMDPQSLAGPDSNEGGRKELTDKGSQVPYIFPYTGPVRVLSEVEGTISILIWIAFSSSIFVLRNVLDVIAVPFACFGFLEIPKSNMTGVITSTKLDKIAWPLTGLLFSIIDIIKTPFYMLFQLLGYEEERRLFQESLSDWHNLEHIIYNMLVEAYHAERNVEKKKKLIPDLALLNADGDRISRNIKELRKLEFVGPRYQPVRDNWLSLYIAEIQRRSPVLRSENSSVLAESTKFDLDECCEIYKSVFFNKNIYEGALTTETNKTLE